MPIVHPASVAAHGLLSGCRAWLWRVVVIARARNSHFRHTVAASYRCRRDLYRCHARDATYIAAAGCSRVAAPSCEQHYISVTNARHVLHYQTSKHHAPRQQRPRLGQLDGERRQGRVVAGAHGGYPSDRKRSFGQRMKKSASDGGARMRKALTSPFLLLKKSFSGRSHRSAQAQARQCINQIVAARLRHCDHHQRDASSMATSSAYAPDSLIDLRTGAT